jgi:hypothetical protein
MSGGLAGEDKKSLPTRADLVGSSLRENPDAPGQYVGYTRNPPLVSSGAGSGRKDRD